MSGRCAAPAGKIGWLVKGYYFPEEPYSEEELKNLVMSLNPINLKTILIKL